MRYLPDSYYARILGGSPKQCPEVTKKDILSHLRGFDLHDKDDPSQIYDIGIDPALGNLDDEVAIATASYEQVYARTAAWLDYDVANAPKPAHFSMRPGWNYWDGNKCVVEARDGMKAIYGRWVPMAVPPTGRNMVYDIETVKVGEQWLPTCAVALTAKGIAVWRANFVDLVDVIPMGGNNDIIGWNIGYDRQYSAIDYTLSNTGNHYLDLMGWWIVCNGMSNQQATAWRGIKGADNSVFSPNWVDDTCTNSLAEVYKHLFGTSIDKGTREDIVKLGYSWVIDNMEKVTRYCYEDVIHTVEVLQRLYPQYMLRRPSSINRAGSAIMGNCKLPLSPQRWPEFYERVESVKEDIEKDTNVLLMAYAAEYAASVDLENLTEQQQCIDWTPALSGKTKGQPAWLRKLTSLYRKGDLTITNRTVTVVLGLCYMGEPVLWQWDHDDLDASGKAKGGWYTKKHGYLPHPEDRGAKLTSMFVKGYVKLFEDGVITGSDAAKELLAKKISLINWVSVRKRVQEVKTVDIGYPLCLPPIIASGTVTGRSKDGGGSVWLVAPNPKKNRVGTELKSMVEAPSGYRIVGADVASEEAWLAGIFGDSLMGYCGSTPLGYSNIIGDKANGTDIHSLAAKTINSSRDMAKTLVYGCVPLSAQALTRNGWKDYHQLNIGDEILAYDKSTKTSYFQPIEHITYHENAELYKLETKHNYEHVSTGDHRWITTQRHRYNRNEQVTVERTTNTLVNESNIITTAVAVGGESPITAKEAAIVAWLITDGSVVWAKPSLATSAVRGTKRGVCAVVFQKKERQCAQLDSLLHDAMTSKTQRKDSGCWTYFLSSKYVRDLWVKAGLEADNEDYVSFVISLSVEARRAFLEAFWEAEGTVTKHGVRSIAQNEGSELESFIVVANLLGYSTRLSHKGEGSNGGKGMCWNVSFSERQHVTCQRMTKTQVANEAVWCPTVSTGYWVMRQQNTVTITGNCLYGQGLKGAQDYLLKANPAWTEAEAKSVAQDFLNGFKGAKSWDWGYSGGIASEAFNYMESLAGSPQPKTPLTQAWMSASLAGNSDFKPTRVNWTCQSSGVDFRDLLLVLVEGFAQKLEVEMVLCIAIHDEVRYLVPEAEVERACYVLQMAHLYTRYAFIRALKLDNLPAGVAWFPEIDIDTVLRKDPFDPQVTPTQSALPLGTQLKPQDLIK